MNSFFRTISAQKKYNATSGNNENHQQKGASNNSHKNNNNNSRYKNPTQKRPRMVIYSSTIRIAQLVLLAGTSIITAVVSLHLLPFFVSKQQQQRHPRTFKYSSISFVPSTRRSPPAGAGAADCFSRSLIATTLSTSRDRSRTSHRLAIQLASSSTSSSESDTSFDQQQLEEEEEEDYEEEDEQEWNAVIAAFQMYKAAYGDLKVPVRFVVPAMPPWPREAWNLKLGVRVASIRSTGRYVENNPQRRKILEDMGFLWRLRAIRNKQQSSSSSSTLSTTTETDATNNNAEGSALWMDGITFDQVHSALLTYKDLYSGPDEDCDMNAIPNSFTVPNVEPWPEITRGMPLGKKISFIKSKVYWANIPGAQQALLELGIDLDYNGVVASNDVRYQKVYVALATYKKMYGDLLVPQPFVVPSDTDQWPREVWGLRLGARVNAIRSQGTFVNTTPFRKQELDDLGFIWENPLEADQKKRGRKKKEVLVIPATFASSANFYLQDSTQPQQQIQQQDQPPPPLNNLGREDEDSWASSIDSWREQQQQQRDFIAPFEYDSPSSSSATTTTSSSSTIATSNAGEEGIPSNLIRREPEPETMQERSVAAALRAGIISDINPQTSYGSIQPRKLSQAWYFDDYGDDFTFQDVVDALRLWGENHNDSFDIQDTYVIKSLDEIKYEERNMGLRIKEEEFTIKGEDDDDFDIDEDDEPPLILSLNQDDSDSSFALRNAAVDSTTSISRNSDNSADFNNISKKTASGTFSAQASQSKNIAWPANLVGMELGAIVRRIREGDVEVKTVPERKAALDAINFDWGNEELFLEIPFEKTMCALFAYFQIRGDLFVYDDFIMPVDEPWPRILQGFELGNVVFQLREKQRFLEKHYPEKKAMLDFLEFVWFPKYQSKLTDFEIEHYKWFNYTQPERDTLDYLFPNAEDYWEDDNPPIFNFTKAKEYIDSLRDLSFLDNLDFIKEDVEEEEMQMEDADVEEEEYYNDEDDDDEDLDEDVLGGYEAAMDAEQEEAESARNVMSSKAEEEDDGFDTDDADEDEEVINEGDDLEIEGVEGIDLAEDEEDIDEEFDLIQENEDEEDSYSVIDTPFDGE